MKNEKVVVSIVGVILLLGMTAQMSFVSAESHDIITVGPNHQGVELTSTNVSGRDITGFTIEIAKSARTNITGVLVESDQHGGCGDWDLDDDEDGRSQEEMEQDNWDSTPKSGKTMWTWYTRVDCMGKDGVDGIPIRKGEQYTIRIWFEEKTKNNAYINIYVSNGDNFQLAGVDIIGQEKDEPEKAAQMLSDMISIPETSKVFFVGPVGPGTVLRENHQIDDQESVELEIPDMPGTYYAFYIDDMPMFRFAHEVRYAWVNVERKECDVVNALWWPQILEPGVNPAPFGLIKSYQISGVMYCYGEGGGTGHENDIDHKANAKPSRTPTIYNCTALVIDGGDADRYFSAVDDAADDFAKDADSIEYYLRENGFIVQRISQYWKNEHPKIQYDFEDEDTMKEQLKSIVEGFTDNPPKEFFLYISAHGDESGFGLFDPAGTGEREYIKYSDLYDWLEKFSIEVNIVIFIDSCMSGGALYELWELEYKNLENGIERRIGLTIMTATDNITPAPTGQEVESVTECFLQGMYSDSDKDGRMGDLGDCWESVEEQCAEYRPWRYHIGQLSRLD